MSLDGRNEDSTGVPSVAAAASPLPPASEPRRKKESTADFWRACRYLAPHRRLVFVSIFCAILVGVTSAGGMGTLVPIIRLLFNDESLQKYTSRILVEHRLGAALADNSDETKVVSIDHKGAAEQAGLKKYEAIQLVPAGDTVHVLSDTNTSQIALQAIGKNGPRIVQLSLPAVPFYYRWMNNVASLLPTHVVAALAVVLGLVGLLTIFANIVRYFQEYYSDKAAILAVNDLRRQLYDHVLHIPLGFFGSKGTSDVTSRLVQDASGLQEGFKTVLGQSIQEPIKAVFFFCLALFIDWRLTLGIVLFGPLMFAIIKKFGKKMRRASRKALQSSSSMLGQLEGTLIGIRVVKAASAERFERRRYGRIMGALVGEQLRMSRIDAVSAPILETLTYFVVCAITIYAAYLLRVTHELKPEAFMGLMACLAGMGESLRKFSKVNNALQKSNAAAARIFETLDVPVEQRNKLMGMQGRVAKPVVATVGTVPGASQVQLKKLAPIQFEVRFESVTFAYPNATGPALRDVDLVVPKGKSIAVVGRNGSGKTTLLALLPRFYDPQSGRITIDGVDIRQATLKSLRSQIGIVTQDAVIFPGTIAENIAYGHPVAARLSGTTPAAMELRTQIESAARQAFAHDFILEKPQGYNTILGEHGAQLSGGQRQRLCIARAILRQTPILILDEATSQVDAESEHLIQQAIESLMHERTTFVIAHRFSTIISADTIVVMEKGQIVGQGRHEELLETCPTYQQLYERQLFVAPTR